MVTFLWGFLTLLTLAVLIAEMKRRADRGRAALERSEAGFRSIFNSFQDVYYRTDMEGRIVSVSPSVLATTGYDQKELNGKEALSLCADSADGDVFMRDVMRTGEVRGYELDLLKKDGGKITVSAAAKVIAGADGQPIAIEGVLRDITAERQANAALKRRADIEKTVAGISADFADCTNIDETINTALLKMSSLTGAGRGHLWQFGRDRITISNSHEWCAPRVETQIDKGQDISSRRFPWLMGELMKGEIVRVRDVAGMPAAARAEQAEFQREKIGSVLILPFSIEKGPGGFVGFDNPSATADWEAADFALLGVAADIIGAALELNRAQSLIEDLTYHDLLTGLPNRRLFEDRLRQALAYAKRHLETLAVLFIDIDGFKSINDDYGFEIGDELLKVVARRISARLRKQDTVARFGGGEFVVALIGIDLARNAGTVAEGVLTAVLKPLTIGEITLTPKAAIGISIYPADAQTTDELVRKADTAMSEAKFGDTNFRFFSATRKAQEEAA